MNANRIMGGGPAFQKGIADKAKMKTTQILKRLWKYLYHFKWFLFLALFMTLTSNILALTGPRLSGMAVDAIHGKGNVEFPKVFFYCGMMLACYGISALFEWLLSRTLIRLSQKIVQQDVYKRQIRTLTPFCAPPTPLPPAPCGISTSRKSRFRSRYRLPDLVIPPLPGPRPPH